MTDQQIKLMTERFLAWRLPEDFNPDGGIEFDATSRSYFALPEAQKRKWEPTGTNLFTYTQAEAMVRHMVEGLE